MTAEDRWEQRFCNSHRPLAQLDAFIQAATANKQEWLIKKLEITFELACHRVSGWGQAREYVGIQKRKLQQYRADLAARLGS